MLTAALLVLLATAALCPIAHKLSPRFGVSLLSAAPLGLGVWFVTMLDAVSGGDEVRQTVSWIPQLGAEFGLRLDGLGLVFALLISFVGGLVLLYASSYLKDSPRLGTFAGVLTAFMLAMLGLVLADNLIVLFVFWELTSITSFLLIGYDYHRDAARKAALKALLVTGLGGMALLAGVIMLGLAGGTFTISELAASGGPGSLTEHPLYVPIIVLVLLGAFTKSAIFPFHFWLPDAMQAPSPVSALLHSSTMVKAGVYLVARLHPNLGGTAAWDDTLVAFGAATMLLAAFLATRRREFKKILAYSTVSSLGTLMMLIGVGAPKAAAAYLLAHALFKGCLFLAAGSVTKQTGQKNVETLGRLASSMPLLCGATVLGALSLAGMFPLLGFVGKELVLKAGLAHPELQLPVTIAAAVAGLLTVMAAWLVGFAPFFQAPADAEESGAASESKGDPGWRQLAGPTTLAIGGLVLAVLPGVFAAPLVKAVATSIQGAPFEGELKLSPIALLWPPTAATWLSIAALALGTVLFFGRRAYMAAGDRLSPPGWVSADKGYDAIFGGVLALAAWQTRVLQNGQLRNYVRMTVLAIGVGAALAFGRVDVGLAEAFASIDTATTLDWVMAIVIIAAAVATTMQSSALAAIAVLGAVGFTIALIFVMFGAPDLGMTQLAVETLVVIIFVLVVFHLRRFSRLTTTGQRAIDAVIGLGAGAIVSALVLAVLAQPTPNSISAYHADQSLPGGVGRNVINVILVDFRAMDTLGELFVLGVASVGVFTLLGVRPARERGSTPAAEGRVSG
jgi:multicomponent Na+:H+ antiporter subunit A